MSSCIPNRLISEEKHAFRKFYRRLGLWNILYDEFQVVWAHQRPIWHGENPIPNVKLWQMWKWATLLTLTSSPTPFSSTACIFVAFRRELARLGRELARLGREIARFLWAEVWRGLFFTSALVGLAGLTLNLDVRKSASASSWLSMNK